MNIEKTILDYFVITICSMVLISCSSPVAPQNISIEQLLSAPEIVQIENKNIVLKTSIYLNLQPVISKKPMTVSVHIETVDSSEIPTDINAKAIYIVNKNEVWKSFFSNEPPNEIEMQPYRIVKIAREGPAWVPNIYVDVIVSFKVNNESYLIKASNQYIRAVY